MTHTEAVPSISCATDPEAVQQYNAMTTDTMTGTAHMLSDCVRVDDHATPSVGMCNGECFMFYGSHTGVQRHDQRHTRKRGAMPCVLSASNGTSRMTTHKHTERLTDGKQTASHVTR